MKNKLKDKKSKKAAIEVQFNWVFVMVAGALILVFFFGVVQKQRQLSQAKISNSLLTNIESIATGAGVSKGTAQSVELPNIGINFDCTFECLCTFSIENIQKEYRDKIIFAPKLVKAAQVELWTLDWNTPFRVTNFVYATTSNNKYFIVYDNPGSSLFKMINKTLPDNVNADFVHFSEYQSIENQNYVSAKFVFVDTQQQIPPDLGIDDSFRRAEVSAVYINTAGELEFYDKISQRSLNFQKKTSSYFGEPAIYAAIFAGDSNAYECNMIAALQRLQSILNLYIARTELMDEKNNEDAFCSEGYSTVNLEELKQAAENAVIDLQNIKLLSTSIASLNTQNEGLLRKSCPLLY